jgi:hypothetical protein
LLSSSSQLPPSSPQLFASLRDHRDWVRCKRGELVSLRVAGDVASLQKQLQEHEEMR